MTSSFSSPWRVEVCEVKMKTKFNSQVDGCYLVGGDGICKSYFLYNRNCPIWYKKTPKTLNTATFEFISDTATLYISLLINSHVTITLHRLKNGFVSVCIIYHPKSLFIRNFQINIVFWHCSFLILSQFKFVILYKSWDDVEFWWLEYSFTRKKPASIVMVMMCGGSEVRILAVALKQEEFLSNQATDKVFFRRICYVLYILNLFRFSPHGEAVNYRPQDLWQSSRSFSIMFCLKCNILCFFRQI